MAVAVSMRIPMLATADISMTVMATAHQTYQQNRTQANDTMKHCSQSGDLKSRLECLR
jgi:hypothetical protein